MEKIRSIKNSIKSFKQNISSGMYVLRIDCFVCGKEEEFIGNSEKEVITDAINAGWRVLDSDIYNMISDYCGCEYHKD